MTAREQKTSHSRRRNTGTSQISRCDVATAQHAACSRTKPSSSGSRRREAIISWMRGRGTFSSSFTRRQSESASPMLPSSAAEVRRAISSEPSASSSLPRQRKTLIQSQSSIQIKGKKDASHDTPRCRAHTVPLRAILPGAVWRGVENDPDRRRCTASAAHGATRRAWQYGMTERRGVRAWRFPRKGQSRVIRRSRKRKVARSGADGAAAVRRRRIPYGRRQQKAQAENRWIHPAFRPRRGKHTRPVSLISIVLQDILPLKASLYVPARFHTA